MKLEEQVCSLELAKKLKELGVKQESLFYWNICHDCEKEYPFGSVNWEISYEKNHGENISAFTASELLEKVPNELHGSPLQIQGSSFIGENNLIFYITYPNYVEIFFSDKNLSNPLAKMLIHLIENNELIINKENKCEI